jgi:hypothetical protein
MACVVSFTAIGNLKMEKLHFLSKWSSTNLQEFSSSPSQKTNLIKTYFSVVQLWAASTFSNQLGSYKY